MRGQREDMNLIYIHITILLEGGMHLVFSPNRQKKDDKACWVFPLVLFGHSRARIVHCAGPHPPSSCCVVCCSRLMYVIYKF